MNNKKNMKKKKKNLFDGEDSDNDYNIKEKKGELIFIL